MSWKLNNFFYYFLIYSFNSLNHNLIRSPTQFRNNIKIRVLLYIGNIHLFYWGIFLPLKLEKIFSNPTIILNYNSSEISKESFLLFNFILAGVCGTQNWHLDMPLTVIWRINKTFHIVRNILIHNKYESCWSSIISHWV